MSLSPRNHNVTLGIACVISCVVMLLFLLHKTHEKLEESRRAYLSTEERYTSIVKQFESLYEYKEKLESSFVVLKAKKSSMTSESDAMKSELSVLKSTHKIEIQRLHDELDACRRREEVAMIHRSQKDEALSPPSLAVQSPSSQILAGHVEFRDKDKLTENSSGGEIKVINNLRGIHRGDTLHTEDKGPQSAPIPAQPSEDPNQDPAGNIFV